jgi:hypothetical protein
MQKKDVARYEVPGQSSLSDGLSKHSDIFRRLMSETRSRSSSPETTRSREIKDGTSAHHNDLFRHLASEAHYRSSSPETTRLNEIKEEIKDILDNRKRTLPLFDAIKRHQKWSHSDLINIRSYQQFLTTCESWERKFHEEGRKWVPDFYGWNLEPHQPQVLTKLSEDYHTLSKFFDMVKSKIQKERSAAGFTFDTLREKYNLSLTMSHRNNTLFARAATDWWRYLYRLSPAKGSRLQTVDAYRKAVGEKAVDLVKGTDIWIRCQSTTLEDVLENGRFKSQFETRRSSAYFDPKVRARFEKGTFGYPEDLDDTLRPLYGYLSDDTNGHARKIEQYGEIAFRLKKDLVKDRTTVSMADSLNEEPWIKPAPYNNPDEGVFPMRLPKRSQEGKSQEQMYDAIKAYDPLRYSSIRDLPSYAEAQIHGGISLADVDKIVLHKRPNQEIRTKLDVYAQIYRFSWHIA